MKESILTAQCPKKVVLYGGTGQAKVVRPIVELLGSEVAAVIDDTPSLSPPFEDLPLLRGFEAFKEWFGKRDKAGYRAVITIGNPHGRARLKLQRLLADFGIAPATVIHPSAVIYPNVSIAAGCQVMAGAVITAETRIGEACIVNTRASIDHENVIEAGAEIAPGATLCGSIHVGSCAWICAGATVLPWLKIGADSIVGAGAVVRRDVPPNTTVAGVPAREISSRERSL